MKKGVILGHRHVREDNRNRVYCNRVILRVNIKGCFSHQKASKKLRGNVLNSFAYFLYTRTKLFISLINIRKLWPKSNQPGTDI